MLTVTDAAAERFRAARDAERREDAWVRLVVTEVGVRFAYRFELTGSDDLRPDDRRVESNGVTFLCDPSSLARVSGATVDFVDGLEATGFEFENPNEPALAQNALAVAVQSMIDETINPDLAAHSGNVSLVDLKDDRLFLEFGGGCRGCRMVGTTLRRGVADRLREAFPEISDVVDATDHEQGVEPYYA